MSKVRADSLVDRTGNAAVALPKGAVVTGVCTATSFVGGLTGNVTGNLTGDVSGNVTGNVTGNLTGNVNASGISTFTNNIQLKSGDGDPARVDFYCESGNSHYTRLKSAPHSEYSGNVSFVLPQILNCAPSSAKPSAIALPIPRLAPVTITTLS